MSEDNTLNKNKFFLSFYLAVILPFVLVSLSLPVLPLCRLLWGLMFFQQLQALLFLLPAEGPHVDIP